MRVTRLCVQNYSRLADVSIDVRKHLVLVGPNDVGKSSLLRCLNLLLGASTAQLYSWVVSDDLRDPDQPLIVEADLKEFDPGQEALFPDEITVDPVTGDKTLTIKLAATFDANQTLTVERTAPDGGTGRQLSREQIAGLGWQMLGAMGLSRDLRADRRSHLDDILQTVDLGPEQATFDALATQFQDALKNSTMLDALRTNLAGQLSRTLPEAVAKDDLSFVPGASAENDVLHDVRLQIKKGGQQRCLSEQSDGTRALFAIALYDMASVGANMVAIDEPEIHLHPTSQRSLARLLQQGGNQKFIATHSADIVGAFEPECIVVVRSGGKVVQPQANFLSADERMTVRWWVRDKLEPLTARRVVAVEGISDRIIVERCADATDRNLDRLGCSLVETNGAGDMGPVIKIFGPSGFDIPMSLLIDADAKGYTASKLGVAVADLHLRSTWVSDPDLEAECVAALGAGTVWTAIEHSTLFTDNERANCTATGAGGTRTADDVAAFCRSTSKHKVRAALVVAPLVGEAEARAIASIEKLLTEIELI
ncbi:ATP-dependent endonuclease [Nocardioides sp. SLBN-35]|uniref:ATP-dependent nuclease n=1 Tax=Nocardioides sp. SLBN-35 TaxID=2768445 RepID=UPI0011527B0E|nr:AAA family ATPase [Nocardioides sp. SLBN-35]TQK69909.1 putative ATP-dependent endonuclease of OLD family [Nocardioides sp. SLBN-35]